MGRRRYTLAELVIKAHQAGHPEVDERLLKWFVTTGLLDKAQLGISRGRAKGIPRYWSDAQLDLLLLLLKNRAGDAHRTATLSNLPVSWWLYRGDTFVPLRQAKRALKTWLGKTEHASWTRSTHSARELVAWFLPNLSGEARDNVVHAIANITYAGRFDADELRTMLRDAAGPENAVMTDGETSYVTDLAIGPIEAIVYTRAHLDGIPDGLYRFARAQHQQSLSEYVATQPQLAANEHIGHLATPVTADALGNRACAHLAQMLGHLLLAADRANPARNAEQP
jgi:hypothetical protein